MSLPTETENEYMTVNELAAHFRIGVHTAYRMIADKQVRAVRLGRGKGTLRIFIEDVRRLEREAKGE